PPTEVMAPGSEPEPPSIDWLDLSTPSLLSEYPFDFGPYKILGELGKGGMGIVYKGVQKDLDRLVSIKVILSNRLLAWKNVLRFRSEAKAAASVRHSNIVGIYETGKVLGQHYIAMEYIEGESLAKHNRSHRLSTKEAVRIVARVARAIAHLHEKNIVHLDLKPSNILIDTKGQPFVTDFGLARGLGGRGIGKDTEAISGTPCYMAPEQAKGDESEIGPLCDVYGLGAILYELLTGGPVFKNEDPFETLVKVIEEEPQPPRSIVPGLPKTIEKICLRCLEKDPEKRYASARELAEDLDRFLAGDVVESTATSLTDQLKCWIRKKPALAAHLIVLSFFAGIECLWFYVFEIRTPEYHYTLITILSLWAISAVGFDRFLQNPAFKGTARLLWAGSDVLFLTAALLNNGGITSHLLILYPILLAASGLWFKIYLVWTVTGITLLSYGFLLGYAYFFRPEIEIFFDRHIIFLASLFSIGFLIALLVRRLELLLSYGRRSPAIVQNKS
ncbi:MAG: serine/threonine protein kinase, partial [Nitrospiria bacterium]